MQRLYMLDKSEYLLLHSLTSEMRHYLLLHHRLARHLIEDIQTNLYSEGLTTYDSAREYKEGGT